MIVARELWNDTGIRVEAGVPYRVRIVSIAEPIADGDGKVRKNLYGLEGWDSPLLWPLCFLKRRPFERYFALIGTVDRKQPARIFEYDHENVSGTLYIAPATGELWCYFNDWRSKYGNNHGKLMIELARPNRRVAKSR